MLTKITYIYILRRSRQLEFYSNCSSLQSFLYPLSIFTLFIVHLMEINILSKVRPKVWPAKGEELVGHFDIIKFTILVSPLGAFPPIVSLSCAIVLRRQILVYKPTFLLARTLFKRNCCCSHLVIWLSR